MSSFENKRCKHCNTIYVYQGSGEGCHNPSNDQNYCVDCKNVILDALKSVPVRFEPAWVPSDIPLEKAIALTNEAREKARANNVLVFERIHVPMFDMKDPDNHYEQGSIRVDGQDICWHRWSKTGDGLVLKLVEIEIAFGIERPWLDY